MKFHHHLLLRRLRAPVMAVGGLALLASLLVPSKAWSHDTAPEFAGFVRVDSPRPRSVVTPDQWEQVLRPADRLGPRPLTPLNAQLLQAARADRWPQVLDLVLKQGADPEATDPRRTAVLVLAAHRGEGDVVRQLLRAGADINRRGDDGFTALGAAAFRGHASLVTQLLKAGANAAEWGITGQSPLHLAALAGHTAVVQRLMVCGVPVDLLNARRETALDVAAQTGQAAVMDQLLAAGADAARAGQR